MSNSEKGFWAFVVLGSLLIIGLCIYLDGKKPQTPAEWYKRHDNYPNIIYDVVLAIGDTPIVYNKVKHATVEAGVCRFLATETNEFIQTNLPCSISYSVY